MPKPKKNKKREDQVKDFSHQSTGVSPKVVQQLAADTVLKSTKDKPYLKRFLILCEGETEAAYFEGLCKVWQLRVNFK